MKIALQLYSIRELVTEDNLWEMMEKVRDAGYNAVEFAGYYNLPAAELKEGLERLGLEPYSSHVAFDLLENELQEVVDYSKTLGLSWVICPYAELKDQEHIDKVAEVLLAAEKALKPYGIKVGYHNHAHEFKKIGDDYVLNLLQQATAEGNIHFELDCCWARYAGVEPAEYLKHLGKKMGPVHFKDLNADYEERKPQEINAVVGQGIVDFEAVLQTMKEEGTLENGAIVEQEGFVGDPWEELSSAARWIKEHLPE